MFTGLMWKRGSLWCLHTRTQCGCGRSKRGRAAVVVSVVLAAFHTAFVTTPPTSSSSLRLICQSLTTMASFPLSPLFFLLWLAVCAPLLCPCELLIILLATPLLQSASLSLSVCCVSSCSLAAPLLSVNSWDAFVGGFHSDGPFEQVVVHVCRAGERPCYLSVSHRPEPLHHQHVDRPEPGFKVAEVEI